MCPRHSDRVSVASKRGGTARPRRRTAQQARGARFDTDEGRSEPRSSSSRITLNNGEESAAFLRLELAFVVRLLECAKVLLLLPLDLLIRALRKSMRSMDLSSGGSDIVIRTLDVLPAGVYTSTKAIPRPKPRRGQANEPAGRVISRLGCGRIRRRRPSQCPPKVCEGS